MIHHKFVLVPKNLCAIIPNDVPDDHAVFTIPAAIGLQGIRLLKPTFGETFLIIGLGSMGKRRVRSLKAINQNNLDTVQEEFEETQNLNKYGYSTDGSFNNIYEDCI